MLAVRVRFRVRDSVSHLVYTVCLIIIINCGTFGKGGEHALPPCLRLCLGLGLEIGLVI